MEPTSKTQASSGDVPGCRSALSTSCLFSAGNIYKIVSSVKHSFTQAAEIAEASHPSLLVWSLVGSDPAWNSGDSLVVQ